MSGVSGCAMPIGLAMAVVAAACDYPTPYPHCLQAANDGVPTRSGLTAGVTTIAGSPDENGCVDGTGYAARFNDPSAVAIDGSGDIYVADYDDAGQSVIRVVTQDGAVTTLGVPNGGAGVGIAVSRDGNIYVADGENNTIDVIAANGVVTILAGSPGVYGTADGTGSGARFQNPTGLALGSDGRIYVADSGNEAIRVITPAGSVTTLAGDSGVFPASCANGTGSAAQFYGPSGIAVDGAGNVYVTDYCCAVRLITPDGVVSSLAGFLGVTGGTDGTGSGATFGGEGLGLIGDLAIGRDGNIYVADSGNDTIRMVTLGGVVTTIAGDTGQIGSVDGPGSAARFYHPVGIAVDAQGNVYVGDAGNEAVREIVF